MKFTDVKQRALRCLDEDAYDHEIRRNLDVKNLEVDVHICRSWKSGGWWYVKFYFMEPDMIFISVHL